jgi:hypothetical protein
VFSQPAPGSFLFLRQRVLIERRKRKAGERKQHGTAEAVRQRGSGRKKGTRNSPKIIWEKKSSQERKTERRKIGSEKQQIHKAHG